MASRVLNRGDCSPFSTRTSVTLPMFAALARASCVKPGRLPEITDACAKSLPSLHSYRLDCRSVGCVAVVTGEVPRESRPVRP